MKKLLLYILTAVSVSLPVAEGTAQTTPRGWNAAIRSQELAQRGDSLYMRMTISIDGKTEFSRQSIDFTPMLTSQTQAMAFPEVTVKGRYAYKNYRRTQALMGRKEREAYTAPYAVIKGYKKDEKVVDYRQTILFEPWMADASLSVRKEDCACGKVYMTSNWTVDNDVDLEKMIEPYTVIPHLAYLQPEAEVIKRRVEQAKSYLDFAVGKTDINPTFGRNEQELGKIRSMIDKVYDDKDVTIKNISIVGYASPEGSLALNLRLSEGRAKALSGYLQRLYSNIPADLYTVRSGGEDWNGLVEMLQATDTSWKQQALNIISSVQDLDGRERKLKSLAGGATWRYMLKEMFPSLRRVIVEADYNVKNFSLEEAREVVKTRPQNLSLNEMFLVANSYEIGSPQFNDLFETAVRLFPEDPTANINAALAAIDRRDYIVAERYLNNVKIKMRIPEYDNAQGLLYMLRDADYDKAESYFKAAAAAGMEAARQNLEQIAIKRENIEQIKAAEAKRNGRK